MLIQTNQLKNTNTLPVLVPSIKHKTLSTSSSYTIQMIRKAINMAYVQDTKMDSTRQQFRYGRSISVKKPLLKQRRSKDSAIEAQEYQSGKFYETGGYLANNALKHHTTPNFPFNATSLMKEGRSPGRTNIGNQYQHLKMKALSKRYTSVRQRYDLREL